MQSARRQEHRVSQFAIHGAAVLFLLLIGLPRVGSAQPDSVDRMARTLQVRLAEGQVPGAFISQVRREYAGLIESVHPLFSLSPKQLAALRAQGEARTGRRLPDLNLWIRITLEDVSQVEPMLETLGRTDAVDIVERAPIPQPPPHITPDFEATQGYLDVAPGGIDARFAWTVPGGTGSGVTVIDVEYDWNQTHEDLSKVHGLALLLDDGDANDPPFPPDHGTAVLGELIADDNSIGVTGIVHDAGIGLAPANTQDLGYNVANAITLAQAATGSGDLILIEQQTCVCDLACPNDGTQSGSGPSEWEQAVFDAISTATAAGRIVVEAAGNGSVNLDMDDCDDTFDRNVRDSGAIIVGAGQPPSTGNDRERYNFSSYGSRLDLQGWGGGVATTGYGFGYMDPDDLFNEDRWYLGDFGGTSSASPIVTGAVAALQGIALANGDPLFTAGQVRDLLIATGSPQLGNTAQHIGPRPNLAAAIITQFPELFPPEITGISPESQTVQYSDNISAVTITAEDIGSDVLTINRAGLPSDLSILPANDEDACTDTTYGTECEWTLEGQMLEASQVFLLTITVTDTDGNTDDNTDLGDPELEITVEEEDVTVTFDPANPVGVQVDSEGGDSGPFTLTTYVTEFDDPEGVAPNLAGDITLADVDMDLVALVGGGVIAGTCAPEAGPISGYEPLQVDCLFDDVAVNAYAVDVTVNGGYYAGSGEDVLVIFDPSLGFTTGGGWFYWPETTDRTSFGFTVQYNGGSIKGKGKGVQSQEPKAQGGLLVIRHLGDGTSHRLKSNAITALALDPDNAWATFLGKATYRAPGWEESEGDYDFMAYVEDHDTPGAGADEFWLQTLDPSDVILSALSMDEPMTDHAVTIEGGDIVVPHAGGNGKNKEAPGQTAAKAGGDEVSPDVGIELPETFEISGNYPNPFNPSTSIRVELPDAAHVSFVVYDATGRTVDRVADREYPAGIHTLSWSARDLPSGVYFYRIAAGPLQVTRPMVLLR